jgi:hypothetical protein
MTIKQQILDYASSKAEYSENFAFSASDFDDRGKFQQAMIDFLRAREYAELEHRCRELYALVLSLHDKYSILNPTIEKSLIDELYGTSNYRAHRLHFVHQANVFLLGLYIYHNFRLLREEMDKEMERTTTTIDEGPNGPFRYSGGSRYGEFLYRWRLSSLCHDIGTAVQSCAGEETCIAQTLTRIPLLKNADSVEDLRSFQNHDFLKELEDACPTVRFSKYLKYHESNPCPQGVCHDHGIIGALIFLRHMHQAFWDHRDTRISHVGGKAVFWHPRILSSSIVQIALSIAVHNLDNHPEAFQKFADTEGVFNLQNHPLAWLLKIADLLQEWEKPRLGEERTREDPGINMKIAFSDSKMIVDNFPEARREKTRITITEYTWPRDVISI